MDKLLYSKISSERAKEYAIATSVYKKTDGTLYVQKKPLYPEGVEHIIKCSEAYNKLEKLYRNTNLSVNKALYYDGRINFEFVSGKSYEELVDEELAKGNKDGALNLIRNYIEEYINKLETIKFVKTNEFSEIFGDYPEGKKAVSYIISNVDLVMSNVLCGKTNVLLDYEWTFDFPVPVDYITYRVIHYYVATSEKRISLNNPTTYTELGIDVNMIPVYEMMERSFQNHIQGQCMKIGEVYKQITPGSIDLKGQILLASDFEKSTITTVYTDGGNGYNEETKKVFTMVNGWFEQEIELDSSIKSVRIDPTECCGLCKLYDFTVDGKEIIKYTTNGHQMDDMIFFKNPDPNIVITFKKKRNHVLKVKLRYMVLDSSYYM